MADESSDSEESVEKKELSTSQEKEEVSGLKEKSEVKLDNSQKEETGQIT